MIRKLKNFYHFCRSLFWLIFYSYPGRKLIVIGVTGTDGKTTTSHLIYEILKFAGIKVALVSTVAAYIGDEEIDTGFHVTTGDAKLLQSLLRKIVNSGFTHVVLEVTSHSLDQYRVLGCNFYIGVLTNITHEHLDYHQTFENYREAKLKLFLRSKISILNQDDPSFTYFQTKISGRIIPYGKTKIKVSNPVLAGEYNLYNIGAAEAVAKIFNVQDPVINKVIKDFSGVPGRLEEIKLGQKFRAIVDFAHTPNALEKVLTELKTQIAKSRKLILVFGCAGLRDKTKRPMMGEVAMRLANKVIITAEDPRTENLDDIYNQITSPLPSPEFRRGGSAAVEGEVFRVDDRKAAIELAVSLAKPGDIVVVTGKGHEKSMCFGTTEIPWSDKEVLVKSLHG